VGLFDSNDLFRCGREKWGKLAPVFALPAKDFKLPRETIVLKMQLRNLFFQLRSLVQEDGQDLVEYALLVALIAFAATSGIHTFASSVNSAFSSIAGKLTVA
jgi:pilus assembly protein Flp/PilA